MRSWQRRSARLVAGALVLLALAAGPASAKEQPTSGNFGLGLIIGSPTGLSAKLYLGDFAIDAALGAAPFGARGIHVHADMLWIPHVWVENAFRLGLYVGAGARLLDHNRKDPDEDDFHVGARLPAGLVFEFDQNIPIDVFVEAAFIVDFVLDGHNNHEGVNLGLNAGLGVRYYF